MMKSCDRQGKNSYHLLATTAFERSEELLARTIVERLTWGDTPPLGVNAALCEGLELACHLATPN